MATQVWYARKDRTIGTYSGAWEGPAWEGPSGPCQRLCLNPEEPNRRLRDYRTFTLARIVRVTEDGVQVWPPVKPRAAQPRVKGRFVKVKAEA